MEFRAVAEQRVDAESRTIQGYAALFDSPSLDLGGFTEVIQRGAFATSLREAANGAQIFAYWNHNSDYVLGSTRSGKLSLVEDEKGLAFKLDASRLTPEQLDAVRDGDMQMSFGFNVRKGGDDWERRDGIQYRILKDVLLKEVSPVSTPAYTDTSAALRSLEAHDKSEPEGDRSGVERFLARSKMSVTIRKAQNPAAKR